MAVTVSAVIPAYNSGKYLARALDSVLAQTCPPDEIIVVDDGSTDDTAAVARSCGDRIRFIPQPNAGASAARNTGIQASTSEWIAFLDADDEWLPDKLQTQLDHLRRYPDLCWTTANFIRCSCGEDTRRDDLSGDRLRNAVKLLGDNEYFAGYFTAYRNYACGWTGTMLIKKQLLLDAGLFDPARKRINDIDMWFRIAYRCPKIGFITRPIAIYHEGVPDSIVKVYTDPQILCDFVDCHLDLARQFGFADDLADPLVRIVSWWIHCCILRRQGKDARTLLKRFATMLSAHYRRTMFIKSLFPRTGTFYDNIKAKLKRSSVF
jgi:glycosyltransferase involved in cell wall biosynthesis